MDKYDLYKTMTSGLQPFPFHRTSGAGGTPDIRIRKKHVLFVDKASGILHQETYLSKFLCYIPDAPCMECLPTFGLNIW